MLASYRLVDLTDNFGDLKDYAKQIKQLEHEGDKITHEIYEQLKEDIFHFFSSDIITGALFYTEEKVKNVRLFLFFHAYHFGIIPAEVRDRAE
jgi:hypothetical protein